MLSETSERNTHKSCFLTLLPNQHCDLGSLSAPRLKKGGKNEPTHHTSVQRLISPWAVTQPAQSWKCTKQHYAS